MSDRYDAIVIGTGPAGETAVSRLVAQGMQVALCERELIGGECAYWACIPSKTLLSPPEARFHAGRSAGLERPEQNWRALAAYRDEMIRHLDDTKQVYLRSLRHPRRDHAAEVRNGYIRLSTALIAGS